MRGEGSPIRKTALVMVGLPARGKTYTARKLARYLAWRGFDARVFNVGNYRRERLGAQQPARFFDPENEEGAKLRAALARAALDDLLTWLAEGGDVAIYDATNSTRARRQWVHDTLRAADVDVVFIESICEDRAIVEANIRETKLRSPDYAGASTEDAIADFRERIANYESAYEPMGEDEPAYVKLIDVNRRVELNRIEGFLPGRIVSFLMNLHLGGRPILLSRHGQSAFNAQGRLGGDSPLTDAGQRYAGALRDALDQRFGDGPLQVWTSTLTRAVATAEATGRPVRRWRALDEISAGRFDGLTYAEIASGFPDEFAARKADKLRYRHPRGESYEDVMDRLEPVLLELERARTPVLVVSHQAVLRALYGYFTDQPLDAIPHLPLPLHTLITLEPKAYGAHERRDAL